MDKNVLLKELLSAAPGELQEERIRQLLRELRAEEPEPTSPEKLAMWPAYMRIMYPEPILDPGTGIMLQPSCYGKECLGNGTWPGYECCCDECDYYLDCYPVWASKSSL